MLEAGYWILDVGCNPEKLRFKNQLIPKSYQDKPSEDCKPSEG
jgi:hypothetical protein